MRLDYEILTNGVIKIYLSGQMDFLGTNAISKEFSELTARHKNPFLVDLSEVGFLASVGIRMLLASAKDLSKRGSRLALLKPQAKVQDVLQSSGISTIIPVYQDVQEALNALTFRSGQF